MGSKVVEVALLGVFAFFIGFMIVLGYMRRWK